MYILGISAYYHDSAAALIKDGKIVAAAQEERFSRIKNDPSFPVKSVQYLLKEGGIDLSQVETIIFYDKPFLKFERILETHYNFAPKSFLNFIMGVPVWLKEKLFLKKIIKDNLKAIDGFDKKIKIKFSEHHLSHSASAFYPSPFKSAAILTIDGVGEWSTATIARGDGASIEILKELHFPHSVGLLYSAFTYYLGFKVNNGEYKLMGLAPYGDAEDEETKRFIRVIKSSLVDIKDDGSIGLNQKYFSYCSALRMVPDSKWKELFGLSRREMDSDLTKSHFNLAMAIQKVTEDIVLKMARTTKELTGERNLCLAGGVALNSVVNGKILEEDIFDNIWIQPAAGDAGGALGAALASYYIQHKNKRVVTSEDSMQGSLLGPGFSEMEIESVLKKHDASYINYDNEDELLKYVSGQLVNGDVIGWFQGRMEWGPRALGNRSILADPRPVDMQKRLNIKIKRRESFRPFAPSILEEDVSDIFKLKVSSPYMLLVTSTNEKQFPAVTHVDGSARVQSVKKISNPRFWSLLNRFRTDTGVGMLVNTSFNVRGEPIVCTPSDAYRCFMQTEMDVLVMGNFVVTK